jgi:pimeloyl-ACP methyl ester carboxylesterase
MSMRSSPNSDTLRRKSSSYASAEWSEHVTGTAQLADLEVDGVPLSGLAAEPAGAPRGLIVALHGGGARAEYWHSPISDADSLLLLAASLGWRAVAFDRPGYGASSMVDRGFRAAHQADLLERAITMWEPTALPVVLVGHSLGAIVAVHLAAASKPPPLIGLSVGGVPLLYTHEQQARLDAIDVTGPNAARPRVSQPGPGSWFGPPGTWDERVLEHRQRLYAPTPSEEFLDARDAPRQLPTLMRAIGVPVQFAVAEHELTTAPARQLRGAAERWLTSATLVEHLEVAATGHNLSLGGSARYYHCRVMAFAERARAMHQVRSPEMDSAGR